MAERKEKTHQAADRVTDRRETTTEARRPQQDELARRQARSRMMRELNKARALRR